jgi:hypothetical protein
MESTKTLIVSPIPKGTTMEEFATALTVFSEVLPAYSSVSAEVFGKAYVNFTDVNGALAAKEIISGNILLGGVVQCKVKPAGNSSPVKLPQSKVKARSQLVPACQTVIIFPVASSTPGTTDLRILLIEKIGHSRFTLSHNKERVFINFDNAPDAATAEKILHSSELFGEVLTAHIKGKQPSKPSISSCTAFRKMLLDLKENALLGIVELQAQYLTITDPLPDPLSEKLRESDRVKNTSHQNMSTYFIGCCDKCLHALDSMSLSSDDKIFVGMTRKFELELQQYNQKLPMYARKEEFLSLATQNQAVVLKGGTGIGKTVTVPQWMFDNVMCSSCDVDSVSAALPVAVLVPRKAIAIGLANYISSVRKCRIGQEVGLGTGDGFVFSDETKIAFFTYGFFRAISSGDSHFSKWGCVILDGELKC